MGAAPLRRAAAARRPPPRAHTVRRAAGSGAPGSSAGCAAMLGAGLPHPSSGATGMRVDRHGHRGRAGLAPAARRVRSARSPGFPRAAAAPAKGRRVKGKKWATRQGPAGACKAGQGNSPPGSRDRPMAPTPCRSSVTRPRSLSATRAAGTRTHPRRHRLPGAPLPLPPWGWRRGGEGSSLSVPGQMSVADPGGLGTFEMHWGCGRGFLPARDGWSE